MYTSPYGINYYWNRQDRWPADFCLDFEPNCFTGRKYPAMNKDTVKQFLVENWFSAAHFEALEVTVEEGGRFHEGGYSFKLTKKYITKGNAGQVLRFEGYLSVHPFDPDYLMIIWVDGHYDTNAEAPDHELLEIGAAWLASVTFTALSPEERKVMREGGKWVWPSNK